MKKKLLFSLVLWAMGAMMSAFATQTLTVYDGENLNSYVPVYGFYADDFLKSEYVIPADDLTDMTGCNITKLTWYLSPASGNWGNAQFQVFLKEVSGTTLSEFSGLTGATVVYEGTMDPTQATIELEFSTPYLYQGGNLLVGCYLIQEGTYKGAGFYGTNVNGASVQGTNGTSLDNITPTQRNFIPKTTFEYMDAGTVVYYKPKNLQVSNITTEGATVTWEAGGDEAEWTFEYKKQADADWGGTSGTNQKTFELIDLDNATQYDVRVRSCYAGDNYSDWTETTFATLICDDADKGVLSYELVDSYGDGWGGNQVQIVHHDSGIVVETLTLPSGKSAEGTVNLCYGEEYDLVWVKGSYPGECGFTFTNEEGEVIYEHESGTVPTVGVLTTFMLTRVTCPKPTDLMDTNLTYNSATLVWTPGDEDQDSWQVIYAEGEDVDPDAVNMAPITVTINPTVELEGLVENTTYSAFVRSNCGAGDLSKWSEACVFTTPEQFPAPTQLAAEDVKARSAVATWEGQADSYTLRYRTPAHYETFFYESFENGLGDWTVVDSDGDGYNWQVVKASDFEMDDVPLTAQDGEKVAMSRSWAGSKLEPDQWLISPQLDLQGELRYWIMDDGNYPETYQIYVSTTDNNIESFQPLTDKLLSPQTTSWTQEAFDLSAYAGQKGYIAFRHYDCTDMDFMFIDGFGLFGDYIEESDWTVIDPATSPCNLTGLDPETKYEMQVQAHYGDNDSRWSNLVQFTTLAEDMVPTELTVAEETSHSAQASWTGANEAYNLRYRKAKSYEYSFFEDFEELTALPDGWTTIDNDGDGYVWYTWTTTDDNRLDANGNPRTLDYTCAYSASYAGSTALTPDNWLITPQVDLGGMLSVWMRGQDPNYYKEHFAIYVSTTGTAVADFTELVGETESKDVYTEYTADLSAYAGQQGYIAIRHFNCTDMFRLNVDNFGIVSNETPAGEWTVVENVTSPYVIEGLDAATDYEVEVQGIINDEETTEWTEAVPFTTLDVSEATLAEIVESGVDGEGYIVSDNPIMVAKTDDDAYVYVTDGNGTWARLEGLDPELFSTTSALVGIEADYANMFFAPTLKLAGEQPTTEEADEVAIEDFDIATLESDDEMPELCQVVKMLGTYDGERLVSDNDPDMGLVLDTSHTNAVLTAGKKYTVVAAIEINGDLANNGAPRRQVSDDVLTYVKAVVISATDESQTAITDVKTDGKGEVRYYDLGGRYVGKSLDNAPAGVYIGSDGVKVIKK